MKRNVCTNFVTNAVERAGAKVKPGGSYFVFVFSLPVIRGPDSFYARDNSRHLEFITKIMQITIEFNEI